MTDNKLNPDDLFGDKRFEDAEWLKEQFDKRSDEIDKVFKDKQGDPTTFMENMISELQKEYLKKEEDETE